MPKFRVEVEVIIAGWREKAMEGGVKDIPWAPEGLGTHGRRRTRGMGGPGVKDLCGCARHARAPARTYPHVPL